jgi:hypothetical protein
MFFNYSENPTHFLNLNNFNSKSMDRTRAVEHCDLNVTINGICEFFLLPIPLAETKFPPSVLYNQSETYQCEVKSRLMGYFKVRLSLPLVKG